MSDSGAMRGAPDRAEEPRGGEEPRAAPADRAGGAAHEPPLLPLVERFAFPRFPGTPGERRAADRVALDFAAAGLHVTREPFHASPRAMGRIRALVSVLAAAFVFTLGAGAPHYPIAAALAGAAFFALVVRSSRWPQFLERLFDAAPSLESENVVGRARPAAPSLQASRTAGDPAAAPPPPAPPPPRIVLLAHLDSKSSRDPTFVSVAFLFVAIAIASILFLRAALAAAGLATSPPLVLTLPLAGFAVFALGRALVNPSGDESPGAMDNASGLALLVDAAWTLPRDPALAGVNLEFVATGAEEIGLAGAMRWIQAHAGELDPDGTLFVNVDSVGVGRGILALDVNGRAPGGRRVRELLRDAAATEGVSVRVLPGLPGVGVDTMPIAARGFATVTLLGRVLGGASRRIHSERDTIDALGEGGLDDARRVVRGVVRAAAAGVSPAAPAGLRRPAGRLLD